MHFPMRLRWPSYIAPKHAKGGSKMQNGSFPSKIALLWKNVCYKVSLCEYSQWQSCKAFTGLSIRAKMVHGGRPLKHKFCAKVNHPFTRQQHHRFGNLMHALFTLQWWQCTTKFTTCPLSNVTAVFGCTAQSRITIDKKWDCRICV